MRRSSRKGRLPVSDRRCDAAETQNRRPCEQSHTRHAHVACVRFLALRHSEHTGEAVRLRMASRCISNVKIQRRGGVMGASADCHSFVVLRRSDAVIEIGLEWPCSVSRLRNRSGRLLRALAGTQRALAKAAKPGTRNECWHSNVPAYSRLRRMLLAGRTPLQPTERFTFLARHHCLSCLRMAETMCDQLSNAQHDQAVSPGKSINVGPLRHAPILICDLAENSGRFHPRHLR